MPPASLRIVLQTGASAGIARVFAVAFSFAAALGALIVWLPAAFGDMPAPHRYLLPPVPIVFALVAVFALRETWRARATDLAADGDGVRILGGRHAGLVVKWADIDPATTRIETNGNVTVTINGQTTPLRTLVLGLRDGTEHTLAASTDPDEQLSLAAVVATLRDAVAPAGAVVDDGPPEVVRCPGCGAPVTPSDDPLVTCWRCDRAVELPQGVRMRVREQRAHDAARSALDVGLAELVRQPTARQANVWLGAALFGPYLLPFALCLGPGPWNAWIAGFLALNAAAKLQVARRAAFHRLSVVFAARPAVEPGAPLRCRSCAGPLPEGGVVVRCPWCEADNVRLLQLERPTATWREAAGDLAAFLAEQRAGLRWPRLVLGFWCVVAIGSFFLPPLE